MVDAGIDPGSDYSKKILKKEFRNARIYLFACGETDIDFARYDFYCPQMQQIHNVAYVNRQGIEHKDVKVILWIVCN